MTIELTEEKFKYFAITFFVAFPQINAITLSNFANGNKSPFYFTFWKDDNFEREIISDGLWCYKSTVEQHNIIKHVKINDFNYLAKTKGVYVMRRSEFNIPSQRYTIDNYFTFALKFGYFFYNINAAKVQYDRRGFHLLISGKDSFINFEFESGYIRRRNNQDFCLNIEDFIHLGSLMINSFKNKGMVKND